jgi:hypothetical protein
MSISNPRSSSVGDTGGRVVAQVLIVDDEPDHADVMADALHKPGHVSDFIEAASPR